MNSQLLKLSQKAAEQAVKIRRDIHQYPELGFTEIRTASKVARQLKKLGYEVRVGREVMNSNDRYGMPSAKEFDEHYHRALKEGADFEYAKKVKDGFTGVVGLLKDKQRKGPTIAIRMDMDALPILESDSKTHFPTREGFRSCHEGLMHACGHDAHTATGLALAEVFVALKKEIKGTLKLIFQPAEEGGRGALPMVKAGVVDDVNYFMAIHFGLGMPSGTIHPQVEGYLASTKLDVIFKGIAAHAAVDPEKGRNALLAAAQAVTGLYAISRHGRGTSRLNVGVLRAGSGRNIIADRAFMMIETRGETAEINAYIEKRARAVIHGTALANDVEAVITPTGSTTTATSDSSLAQIVAKAASEIPNIKVMEKPFVATGSEDATYFMRRVQERGGKAVYIGIGSDIPSGHHTPTFNVQEKDFTGGIAVLVNTVLELARR